jgi:hypothetical protein
VSEKALEPMGASRPAWRQLADLAMALGYPVAATSLKQLRLKAIGGVVPEPVSSSHVTTSAD